VSYIITSVAIFTFGFGVDIGSVLPLDSVAEDFFVDDELPLICRKANER
jgi:hypothetical protein